MCRSVHYATLGGVQLCCGKAEGKKIYTSSHQTWLKRKVDVLRLHSYSYVTTFYVFVLVFNTFSTKHETSLF